MAFFDDSKGKALRARYIEERTRGEQTPLSIGTAMIFESEHFNVKHWEEYLYVNIRTLYRNFTQAMELNKFDECEADDLFPKFVEEIELFEEELKRFTGGNVKLQFYLPDYSDISRLLPMAILRHDKTRKQVSATNKENQVMKLLKQEHDKMVKENRKNPEFEPLFIECGSQLPRGKGPALILTHVPSDLLSSQQFPLLKLIESHTGKIKAKKDWNTKLTGDPDAVRNLPFCKMTLQICGDKSVLVASGPLKMKQYLFQMANDNNWTSQTTENRIRYSIERIKSLQDKEILRKFL